MKTTLTILLILLAAPALADDDAGFVGAVAGAIASAMDISGGDDD